MKGYLFDNNTLSFWHNDKLPEHHEVRRHVAGIPPRTPLRTSVVVLGEIEDGHRRIVSPGPDELEKQAALRTFIRKHFPKPLPITRHTVEHYGEIRSRIFRHCFPRGKGPGRPERWICPATAVELGIEENDLWIASQAVERGLILVTHDKMNHIQIAVRGLLTIEDWTKP